MPIMTLVNDGTLDTVVECANCGTQFRGIWHGDGKLEDFVAWLIAIESEDHVCASHPFFGPTHTLKQEG